MKAKLAALFALLEHKALLWGDYIDDSDVGRWLRFEGTLAIGPASINIGFQPNRLWPSAWRGIGSTDYEACVQCLGLFIDLGWQPAI